MQYAPSIVLNDGASIPQLGLGVWQLDNEQARISLLAAFAAGYRHVDTAMIYGNEVGVGRAVAESGLARRDIFVTTKLWNADHGHDAALRAFDVGLARLGLDYVDLYLIHWPMPRHDAYVASWRALMRLREEGRVRSIGVSNFNMGHLQRLLDETDITPAVNQIELHPDFMQKELVKFCRSHDIAVQAWSPLGQGGALIDNPVLASIGATHGKTSGQVILRWHMQHGYIANPRSRDRQRIAANFAVFDFKLNALEMAAIDALDSGNRLGPDPEQLHATEV